MKKAIDVSHYQGVIDWDAVKASGVEFAILRGGIGDDILSQDDKQFERNWAECQRVGIACTMYLFSYAAAKGGDISSELAHIKRLMSCKKMNCSAPIYIDVENTTGLNWRSITNEQMLDIFKRYKAGLAELGFGMGIYSSRSAFWNEKMTDPWYAENVSIWVAEYASQVNNFTRPFDLWQYSSSGSVAGINGRVDMNWLYADFTVDKNQAPELHTEYRVYADNHWLVPVTGFDANDFNNGYAGIPDKPARAFAATDGIDGDLVYEVGVEGLGWLGPVDGYDITDTVNGYAGRRKLDRVLTSLRVKSKSGKKVSYAVGNKDAWSPIVSDWETAFVGGAISRVMLRVEEPQVEKPADPEPVAEPQPTEPVAEPPVTDKTEEPEKESVFVSLLKAILAWLKQLFAK